MKVGLYAGSFDPFTNGHLNIIERSLSLFDEIHIVIAVSPLKKSLFTDLEREKMLNELFAKNKNIKIRKWSGLIVDYAKNNNVNFLIRGLRPTGDFEVEFQMASMNKKIYKDIETFFLMTEDDHYFISSSLVKEIHGHGGDISPFVPSIIHSYLAGDKSE